MNQELPKKLPKTRIMREITPKWDEVMRNASQMKFGEIIIKIHDKKIRRVSYLNHTDGDDVEEFIVQSLDGE